MIKVLIVDDEPLARENLRVFLQEQSDIEIVGECSNAVEGIGAVHKLRPDVLFLDIQMPRISGLEMVGMLDPEHRPYIVFLTAFDEYAIKAFEEHAFDYLLKPIDEARLEKTLARLRQERSKQDVSLLPRMRTTTKTGLLKSLPTAWMRSTPFRTAAPKARCSNCTSPNTTTTPTSQAGAVVMATSSRMSVT